ncbi:MAG TPA: hypothetical protein VGV61_14445 [Thermoanaerobaculia bacterium]|jgi:hypothetical protein|nr:hypothetical protein [Thermoanaerobaculia bacterium]
MVQPQQPVPPKKGMSVWAWVAIGCVGILVLGGVAVGGFVWWGAHKVKSMAAEYQAHPEVATMKMITAMNPDLEMVSADEAAGKVTIRNKKTGEVVTLDMKDIKEGKINFSDAKGAQASVNFDQQAGKMEVRGANGEVATFGGAAQAPDWVPVYPGGTTQAAYSAQSAEGSQSTFSVTTSDGVDKVFAFYKERLESGGFKVNTESHYGTGDSSGGMLMGESADGKRTLMFTIGAEGGKTTVAVVAAEKKAS